MVVYAEVIVAAALDRGSLHLLKLSGDPARLVVQSSMHVQPDERILSVQHNPNWMLLSCSSPKGRVHYAVKELNFDTLFKLDIAPTARQVFPLAEVGRCAYVDPETRFLLQHDHTQGLTEELIRKPVLGLHQGFYHYVAVENLHPPLCSWSLQQVFAWLESEGFRDFINIFRTEEIDGKKLLTIERDGSLTNGYLEERLGLGNAKEKAKFQLRLKTLVEDDGWVEKMKEGDSALVESEVFRGNGYWGWGNSEAGRLGASMPKGVSHVPRRLELPAGFKVAGCVAQETVIRDKDHALWVLSNKFAPKDEKQDKGDKKEKPERHTKHEKHAKKQLRPEKAEIEAPLEAQAYKLSERPVWALAARKGEIATIERREAVAVEAGSKKSKLRTAKEVLSQIEWDPAYEVEDFVVGYDDMLEGLLEMPVAELKNSEVKNHRLVYFKRKGAVVWHRNKRIDSL